MIRVVVNLDAPNALLGTDAFGPGALVRLERSATEAGVYAEVDISIIVADTFRYTYWDPSGTETHWYRYRVSNALNTAQSAYSDPFQGDDLSDPSVSARYATVDAILQGYEQRITDTKVIARLDDNLLTATGQISELVGFDFFRHPASGTEARLFEASGSSRLCVHEGIIPDSVTLLEIRGSISSTYDELAADGWVLEDPERPGWPSFHLNLTGLGTWHSYPYGRQLVRVTAAFGWPAVPASVRKAAIHRARQLASWDPTKPGGPTGPEELGVAIGPNRMPDTMYRLRHDFGPWELGTAQCSM